MSGACAVDPRRTAVERSGAQAESEWSCPECGVGRDAGQAFQPDDSAVMLEASGRQAGKPDLLREEASKKGSGT